MSGRASLVIVTIFALVWLSVGAGALPMPWQALVGVAGALALVALAWRTLRRGGVARPFFRPRRYAVTVAIEFAALFLAGKLLDRLHLTAYVWPVIGIIVALHFIGLWWASNDRRFLALCAAMLAINLLACLLPAGPSMLALCGFGNAAALAAAMARR